MDTDERIKILTKKISWPIMASSNPYQFAMLATQEINPVTSSVLEELENSDTLIIYVN